MEKVLQFEKCFKFQSLLGKTYNGGLTKLCFGRCDVDPYGQTASRSCSKTKLSLNSLKICMLLITSVTAKAERAWEPCASLVRKKSRRAIVVFTVFLYRARSGGTIG